MQQLIDKNYTWDHGVVEMLKPFCAVIFCSALETHSGFILHLITFE